MSEQKKQTLKIVITISIIVALVGILALLVIRNIEEERIMEQERKIERAYQMVNILLYVPFYSEPGFGSLQYRPFVVCRESSSERWGICTSTYLFLRMYEEITGKTGMYEMVIDYFSEEFEPDGSLRLYNNGKHPEIQALVEWRWERGSWKDFAFYMQRIADILSEYRAANEDFEITRINELSPQMLDALVRAEADPDYVLDLTSIQQAGY